MKSLFLNSFFAFPFCKTLFPRPKIHGIPKPAQGIFYNDIVRRLLTSILFGYRSNLGSSAVFDVLTAIKKIVIFIIPAFLLSILPVIYVNAHNNDDPKQETISISNGKIKLEFNNKTGAISGFRDLVGLQDFLNPENGSSNSPWEVDILQAPIIKTIDITNSYDFHFYKQNDHTVVLMWENFPEVENRDFKITAVISLPKDQSVSSWKISVEGIKGVRVTKVVFPKITGIQNLGDENLAVPVAMGQLMKNPRLHLSEINQKIKKYEWNYPDQLSMQWSALYGTKDCDFYVACNDASSYRKNFSFSLDSLNNMVYQMDNFPSIDSSLGYYSLPYEAIIGCFRGDWITAAEMYRKWGTKQQWCSESRFKTGLTPAWLEKTSLWVWNRGKSKEVLTPAIAIKKKIHLPVSVFWHWWHGCAYDDGFPEYFPPREGKKSFINALSSAQRHGIKAIVYMNQGLWGTSTESWKKENASLYSVKLFNGEIKSHVFNIFTGHALAFMCITTPYWKNKYASLSHTAINKYLANGIYMDMACTSSMCYDKTHRHSIGGGNYWVKNFGELTRQIRSGIRQSSQAVLAGEGCGESWLPYLDAFLTLQVSKERYAGLTEWETIPLFQAVYHQYGITYGNYSSLVTPPYDELWPQKFAPEKPEQLLSKEFSRQFLMEQARSFVWGMQPTIANYKSFLGTKRREEVQYLVDLVRVRFSGLKYLLYGKFMRPPEMKLPERQFKISKLSIYTGKAEEKVTAYQKTYPLIYSGAWKSNNNQLGIALASIADNPFQVNFVFKSDKYGLAQSGKIFIIDVKGKRYLSSYSGGTIKVDFTLKAKEVNIVEIIPDR